MVVDDVNEWVYHAVKIKKDVLRAQLYDLKVEEYEGRESYVLDQDEPPHDEYTVTTDTGHYYRGCTSEHGQTVSI